MRVFLHALLFGVALPAQMVTTRPSSFVPRAGAAVAFEPNTGYGYLYGGAQGSNELWRHDEGVWVPVATAHSPPGMTSAVACTWPGHGMLVSGAGQVWLFDGVDWTQVVSAPVTLGQMVFDPVRSVVVAWRSPTELWEFDGSNWMQRLVTWPFGGPPVHDLRLAWEPATQSVMAIAGTPLYFSPAYLAHRLNGTAWTNGVPVSVSPGFSVATAPGNAGVLASGGWMFPFFNGATFLWNGAQVPLPALGAPPPRVRSHAWFDSVRGRTVVTNADTGDFGTWYWDGASWSRPPAGTMPSFPNASCYDTWRGQLLQFGGIQSGSTASSELLARGTDGLWRSRGQGPPARMGQATAFDSWRGRMVMIGGVYPDTGGGHSDLVEPGTHEWDGATWISHPFPGWPWNLQAYPYSRSSAAMAFDRVRGRCVLFGGEIPAAQVVPQGVRNDTWEWDGTAWTRMQPATVPPAVLGRMHFDPDLGRCVLQAGGAWIWDGVDWTPLSLPSVPGTASLPSVAFDEAREVYLTSTAAGTWELRNGAWQLLGTAPFPGGHFDLGRGRFVGADWRSWYEIGDPAAAFVHPFGEACAGSAGKPVLHAERPFRLGTTRTLQPAHLPPGAVCFGALGSDAPTFLGLPLPIDLTGVGMPQCWLHTEIAADELFLNGSWSIAVPSAVALLGAWFRLQAFVLDPAANMLGVTSTNGLRLRIGV